MLDQIQKFGLWNPCLAACGLSDEPIPKMGDQFGSDPHEVLAGGGLLRHEIQRRADIAGEHRLGEVLNDLERSEAEDIHHIVLGDVRAAEGNHLVEHALGIAQPPLGPAGKRLGGGLVELDLLAFRDVEKVLLDEIRRDAAEIETLATAGDGRGNLLRLGRREDELHMRGRLLERFEKRVERAGGEHVHLVDEVDFKRPAGGGVGRAFAEIADVFHAVVARAVDLHDIEAAPLGDLEAGIAFTAGLGGGALLAIQRLRQDARGRGFPDPSRTDEKVSLREAFRIHRVLERARDVVLPDDLGEGLRTVFSGEHTVTHARTLKRVRIPIQQDFFARRTRDFLTRHRNPC